MRGRFILESGRASVHLRMSAKCQKQTLTASFFYAEAGMRSCAKWNRQLIIEHAPPALEAEAFRAAWCGRRITFALSAAEDVSRRTGRRDSLRAAT